MQDMKKLTNIMRHTYEMVTESKIITFYDGKVNMKTIVILTYYLLILLLIGIGIFENSSDEDYIIDTTFDIMVLTSVILPFLVIGYSKKENMFKLYTILSKDLYHYSTPFSVNQLQIKEKAWKQTKHWYCFSVFAAIAGSLAKISPSLFYLMILTPGDLEAVNLPIHCWLPYFIDSLLMYVLVYCFLAFYFVITTIAYISLAPLFFVSIIYTCKEIKILTETMKELDEKSAYLESRQNDDYFAKRTPLNHDKYITEEKYLHICMKEAIQHHIKIISLAKLLNDTFGFFYFVIAQGTCFVISLSAHRLSNVPVSLSGDFVNYSGLCLATFFTLGMTAWFGQLLIDEDENFRQALYNCNWINKSVTFRKYLILMLERTKQPLCIRIGKIYILNFNTFSYIMNAAYTYFNLLRTVKNNKSL